MFGPQRDLGITIGGIEADMSEPSPDNIDVNACFQQVDSRSVAQGMGKKTAGPFLQSAALQRGRVSFYDFVNSESCQWLSLLGNEHRSGLLRLTASHQLLQ